MACSTPSRDRRPVVTAVAALAALALVSGLAGCGGSATPRPGASSAPSSVAAPSSPAAVSASPSHAGPSTSAPRPPTSEPAQAEVQGTCERTLPAYPVVQPGAQGTAVRTLQCFLDDADYGPVLVDGVYGTQTRAAVSRVESGFEGAPPHPGRIDAGMWVLLISRSLGAETLREGASGREVTTLQRALRAAGGTIAVDGVFGPQTRRVVEQFQKANSITVDGIVGEETLFFLKGGGVITRR